AFQFMAALGAGPRRMGCHPVPVPDQPRPHDPRRRGARFHAATFDGGAPARRAGAPPFDVRALQGEDRVRPHGGRHPRLVERAVGRRQGPANLAHHVREEGHPGGRAPSADAQARTITWSAGPLTRLASPRAPPHPRRSRMHLALIAAVVALAAAPPEGAPAPTLRENQLLFQPQPGGIAVAYARALSES